MTSDADVLVIGGGLAGCTAALAAARAEADATVRLLTAEETTLGQASGLIDVLGYTPSGYGPLENPFERLGDLPDDHPYTVVGEEAIRAGLALFDEVSGERYGGEHTDANALVPTYGGAFKPTARYPITVEPGLVSKGGNVLVVGFDRLTAYDGQLLADRLEAAGMPVAVNGVDVQFPADLEDHPIAPQCAAALDDNELVTVPGNIGQEPEDMSLREALAAAIYPYQERESRVGVPPVLGTTDTFEIQRTLSEEIGASVFEIPMGPPSIPGRRLESLLHEALANHDVILHRQSPVVEVAANDRSVEHVSGPADGETERYQASEYVLATGGLVGAGIESDRDGVHEPLFDCHVSAPPDRYDWFEDDVFGDHAFPGFGVDVDGGLRPLDADGEPEYVNLRAAGAVIGGYDFAAEKSGSGVSLATGHVAGTRAAEDSR